MRVLQRGSRARSVRYAWGLKHTDGEHSEDETAETRVGMKSGEYRREAAADKQQNTRAAVRLVTRTRQQP